MSLFFDAGFSPLTSARRHLGGTRTAQRGVVLVVALIFLLLMTILAISASGRSLLQERMAGGLRNVQLAEWSAETALRGVEWQLINGNAVPCYNSANAGAISANVTTFRSTAAWSTSGTKYAGTSGSIDWTSLGSSATLGSNPYYIVEYLGVDRSPDASASRAGEIGSGASGKSDMYLYRITARGQGANANTVRLLETTFVSPFKLTCTLA